MIKAKNATRRKVKRECVACGALQPPFYGIPDPCLPVLAGVANACCGHGCEEMCYVHFDDDPGGQRILRGTPARRYQIRNGGTPARFTRLVDEAEQDFYTFVGWRKIPDG